MYIKIGTFIRMGALIGIGTLINKHIQRRALIRKGVHIGSRVLNRISMVTE